MQLPVPREWNGRIHKQLRVAGLVPFNRLGDTAHSTRRTVEIASFVEEVQARRTERLNILFFA